VFGFQWQSKGCKKEKEMKKAIHNSKVMISVNESGHYDRTSIKMKNVIDESL